MSNNVDFSPFKREEVLKHYEMAKRAREKAHAPYSRFRVGACFAQQGQSYSGQNFEDMVMGLSLCAEQVALVKLLSELGKDGVAPSFLVVVTDQPQGAFPCGVCRQMMASSLDPELVIFVGNLKEIQIRVDLKGLLPHGYWDFTPESKLES